MALEAQTIAEAGEMAPGNRRAKSERRGKDRRKSGARVNTAAPRRSLMKIFGAWASGMSFALFAIVFLATIALPDRTPWTALTATGTAVVVSLFSLMLGSLEQRLIEIRLELMMANGGMRQADRRSGERRTDALAEADPIVTPSPPPLALKGLAFLSSRERNRRPETIS